MHMRHAGVLLGLIVTTLPTFVLAFPFGGQASIVRPCYNAAIYAALGPPRGGPYIWTTATKTYQFGPPRATGQWLLGLASVPYHCVVSINPIYVWAGTAISMMGSSQPGGGGFSGGAAGSDPTLPKNTGGCNDSMGRPLPQCGGQGAGVGHVLISELFAAVDSAHGASPANQWVELYNASNATVNVSGWLLSDAAGTGSATPIPNGTYIQANTYLVLTPATSTNQYWSIPSSTPVVVLGRTIGDGIDAKADRLSLITQGGANVDGVSWGTDTSLMNPAAASTTLGRSLIRSTLSRDTDTASDWVVTPSPTPGR